MHNKETVKGENMNIHSFKASSDPKLFRGTDVASTGMLDAETLSVRTIEAMLASRLKES